MTNKLKDITKSEVFTGVLLIIATIVSLIIANLDKYIIISSLIP